jgi:hypothetical protein
MVGLSSDVLNMKLLKPVLSLLACAGLSTLFTGCASMICGTHQDFTIDSKPKGADVLVYNSQGDVVFQDKTPCTASLERVQPEEGRANYIVLIRKDGYTDLQMPLVGKLNNAYLANVLFGGVGLAIDPMTGAMWTLCPEGVDREAMHEHTAFLPKENTYFVTLKDKPEEQLTAKVQGSN